MHKRITFRNMTHSGPMEDHVNEQLTKIEKFLSNEPTPIYIDMILEASKIHAHPRAELHVKTPHYDLMSEYEHEGVDMYDVIDRVIDVMYRQLHQKKEKETDRRKVRGRHDEFKKQR